MRRVFRRRTGRTGGRRIFRHQVCAMISRREPEVWKKYAKQPKQSQLDKVIVEPQQGSHQPAEIVDPWNHALRDEFGLEFHHETHCKPYGYSTTVLEEI